MSNLPKQLKKVLQSPGSPKKKAQAKSTQEKAEHICRTQHEEAIQRSRSSLPLIQAQSSEADEHLLYLDPQNLGLPVPDSDYPIGEEVFIIHPCSPYISKSTTTIYASYVATFRTHTWTKWIWNWNRFRIRSRNRNHSDCSTGCHKRCYCCPSSRTE